MPDACYAFYGLCISNKVDLGLFLTLVLFLAGLMTNSYIGRRKAKITRRSYIKALAEEIKLNIIAMEKYIGGFPALHDINTFLAADRENRPLLTFSYYSVIYRNRTEVLQDLPDKLISNIVEFYGRLEELAIDVASVDKDAFTRISAGGRESVIHSILLQHEIALQQGRDICSSIQLLLSTERIF